jgi:hypothetical protein
VIDLCNYFFFPRCLQFSRLSICRTKKFIRMKTPSEWLVVAGLVVLSLF